jgi:SpoVK/Ycf46/Vps4 family AAA+-type ATPase
MNKKDNKKENKRESKKKTKREEMEDSNSNSPTQTPSTPPPVNNNHNNENNGNIENNKKKPFPVIRPIQIVPIELFDENENTDTDTNKKDKKRRNEDGDGDERRDENRKRRYRRNNDNPPPPPQENTSSSSPHHNVDDDDIFSPLFTILLGNPGGGGGGGMGNRPLQRRREEEENNEDDFENYFKESTELHPIDREVNTLQDLIELGESYDINDPKRYVINMRALHKCVSSLKELNHMIGMKNVKEMVLDLIFFRLQNIKDTTNRDEMWHTVIEGTPGSGKTELARILGKIYYGLGICKKDKFTAVKRSDMIGKYLGHTAKMTQEIFDSAKGGILFIDEAYALGNPEQRDSFSKECIDTINQNLTENKDTIVFIAGYKEQLQESFFSYNPGLNRRFKFRITVDIYNAAELRSIYLKKLKDDGWNIFNEDEDIQIPLDFFERNREMFKYNGGDMENLWHLTKIAHSRRIFGKSIDLKKKINEADLRKSFDMYCQNGEVKTRKNDIQRYIRDTMYC